ncbi:ABC transporter permease [Massilibacteroides sp.]|uniref:ABC transporter permease n=1 Tax=Massilibacteroides sp. TaxID=2034766 RepID=UPI002636F5A6|nr:ABC transporter permease [Massilibacteroides sp.]MDD4514292.1 ABC transporter permease [Massilibacteroides sp.]
MNKELVLAFRSLFKKGRNNHIKILSLAVGLAMGLVLIAKVYFEQTFDNFYPDGDRVYHLTENFTKADDDEPGWHNRVSGAIAVGMREELPEVEAGTRFTNLGLQDAIFYTTDDKRNYSGNFILADSCLFDVLPRPVLAGDVKQTLSRPMYVIVSKSIADKIGSDVIGKTIEMDTYPGKIMTIGAIFDDIPENSHYRYDVAISMSSIGEFMWDGSMNWLGNDRYSAYVRLSKGVTPESIAASMHEMQTRHQPMEKLKKLGMDIYYTLNPLLTIHSADQNVKRMSLLLGLLAFALLFTAVMNYILIVISTLVGRSKEVAVYKCYGASGKNITSLMLAETTVHLTISIITAVLLVAACQPIVKELLGTSLIALLSWEACLLLLGVCVLVYLLAGLIPAQLFARIPVAVAFRNYRESRRNWKLGLLFIQFIACAFLVTLLVIIGRQYTLMVNDNPGYNYENVVYCETFGTNKERRQQAINELSRIPGVDMVATSSTLPFQGMSGNNVSLPGRDEELFNFADMEDADINYFKLLQIPIMSGKAFDENSAEGDIVVSKSFEEKMALMCGWTDGAVGKEVRLSQWELRRIVGVYNDIRVSSIANMDERPSVLLYTKEPQNIITVRLHQMNSELIQQVTSVLENSMPDKHLVVIPYSEEMINLYKDSRVFRDSVMIGGIVTLLISLIGLVGYTNDEINRRRAEIAVRRINGATLLDILRIFLIDILKIAIPAIVLGGIAAYFTAVKWQEQFAEKSSLTIFLFIACGLAVLSIILTLVSINGYRVANQNPVESLRNQ